MVTPLLRGEGLVRRYGRRTVLDLDEITLHAGEVLAVVGPNGAGKSTLFRILLLLERADSGAVFLEGKRTDGSDADARRRIAGVFQRPILFSGNVRDNLAFGLRARGMSAPETAQRVLDAASALGLHDRLDANVHTLSGGEAQRVALARALVIAPDVLLLDEPAANLDVTVRRQFRQDLERVARQHARGIILITHDPLDAFGIADRVLVLQAGRALQVGTPEEMLLRPQSPFVAELTGAELLLRGTVTETEGELAGVRVEGATVWTTIAPNTTLSAGQTVVIAYRPEDVMLAAMDDASDLSAMNALTMTVDAVVPAGSLTRVRLRQDGGIMLHALVTRRSAEALGLQNGVPVRAHIKATALHAWQSDVLHR